jgi:hypothetical protein
MKTSRTPHRITLALLATLVLARQQASHAQETPQPAPEIKRMTALVGTFEGDAAYTAAGNTTHFTLHHVNRAIVGGFGLQTTESADIPGMGHYEAENLFGWDAGRKQLHLYSVTNDPYTHDHAGPWTDATHATLRYEGMRDGKKLVEVIPMEIVGADEYRFKSTITVDGKNPEVFVATMKRVRDMSAR